MKPKTLSETTQKFWVKKYRDKEFSAEQIRVVAERSFRIIVNEEIIATIMLTPSNLEEFLVGFLIGQGVIEDFSQIKRTLIESEKGLLWAEVDNPLKLDITKSLITSGCAGGITFENFENIKPFESVETIQDADTILKLMKETIQGGDIYTESGGVHSASLADVKELIFTVEDIGRHNAIDKVIGYLIKNNIDPKGKMILTTGRLSLEAIPKVARARIGVIGSRSTPTDLAIELARKLNVLLLGYIRADKITVYNQ